MSRTARRRWSRELTTQVDGLCLPATGPILLHGYEEPAGGKWNADVIPGKMGAIDRNSGATIWSSPCEVGYGRGFGAGFGRVHNAVVLGPSGSSHRAVRMDINTGELLMSRDVPAFDQALVFGDMCYCLMPDRILAIGTDDFEEVWSHRAKKQRFHLMSRQDHRVFVVFSDLETKKQGVLVLDALNGDDMGVWVDPAVPVIHGLAAGPGAVVLLVEQVITALSREGMIAVATQLGDLEESGTDTDGLALLALETMGPSGQAPLWFDFIPTSDDEDFVDASIESDSGKLYVTRGNTCDVRDTLTGRPLGDVTIPGLDEHVAWSVAEGAFLLGEETRISLYEVPI